MSHELSRSVSVIIPVVNEASRLGEVLAAVGPAGDCLQVIVVDGGSCDASRAVAVAGGAQIIDSPVRQRAAQMNLGAQQARGEVLHFLHADTFLPAGWLDPIAAAFTRSPRCVGGAFRRRFDLPSPFLRATCRLADWRGRRLGLFLGDQAMFVWREVFERLGGFRSLRLFEDFEFSRRLSRVGPVVLLENVVVSSGRRFLRRGPVRQTLADLALTWRFLRQPEAFVDAAPLRLGGGPGIQFASGASIRDTWENRTRTTTSLP